MKNIFELGEDDIRPKVELNYNREVLYYKDLSIFNDKFQKDFKQIECISCASEKHHKIFVKDSFSFRKCTDCETVFVSPRPDPQALEWWYTNSEQVKHSASILEKTETNRAPIYEDRIEKILDRVSEPVNYILEIGCSNGNFLKALSKVRPDWNCTGIDMSPDALKLAKQKGINCVNMSAEKYAAISNEKYDLIFAFEILEHVYDPFLMISALTELLNDNGVIYLTMPNYIAYDFLQVGDVYRNIMCPSHLNYFNENSIKKLLQRCGFNDTKVFCDGVLDTSIVSNYHNDKRKVLEGFWGHIYDNSEKYSDFLIEFQKLLQMHKLSGNMTVMGYKKTKMRKQYY